MKLPPVTIPPGWERVTSAGDKQMSPADVTSSPHQSGVRCRQQVLWTLESTRCDQRDVGHGGGGMVASDVDRKCEWPLRPAWQPGGTTRANDLVMGVGWPAARSYDTGGSDVIRVPVPARAHTAPRRGLSAPAGRWSFDRVFVLPEIAPARASTEGAGMT